MKPDNCFFVISVKKCILEYTSAYFGIEFNEDHIKFVSKQREGNTYAHVHSMSLISTKFHEILLCGFRGEQERQTDGHTHGRPGQKHYTLCNFVAWGMIKHLI